MIKVNSLLDIAKRRSDSTDYEEHKFIEDLRWLVDSVNGAVNASGSTLSLIEEEIINAVTMRINIENLFENSAIKQINAPIFIAGTGRTATTYLQKLLSLDSDNRVLKKKDIEKLKNKFTIFPKEDIENIDIDEPSQCAELLETNFTFSGAIYLIDMPDYENSCYGSAQADSYKLHKKALQILQENSESRWVLKSSIHAMMLDSLYEVYPDAKIVQIHRDPISVYFSRKNSAISTSKRSGIYPDVSIDSTSLKITYESISQILDFRKHNKTKVYDGYYQDFVGNPMKTLSDIYDFFDMTLSNESLKKISKEVKVRNALHKTACYPKYTSELPEWFIEKSKEYKNFFHISDEV